MNDLVSIVLPIYNKEEVLGRCVDSLIGQSYDNVEIILVDDGSSDGSWNICKEYEQKDIRITAYHKENEGLAPTRNYGISKATGKWISFIDPDDWVEPDYIKDLLGDSPAFDLSVCCAFFILPRQIKTVSHVFGNSTITDKESIYDRLLLPMITLDESRKSLLSCVWNKLYRKSVIDDNKIRFDKLLLVEDYLFNVRFLKVSSCVKFIDTPLYDYDCTQPLSLTMTTKCTERLEVSKSAHQIVKELFPGIGDEVFPSVMLYNIYNNIYTYARRNGFGGFKAFCDYVYEWETFINIAGCKGLKDVLVVARRKNLYLLYISWAYLYAIKGFLKHYISKLLRR